MARLWIKTIVRNKIERQTAVPCALEDAHEILREVCREFDIPAPLWLNKQEREFDEFRRTQFLADSFMEDVPFQKLEIEFLEDDGKKRKSTDPRNQFD